MIRNLKALVLALAAALALGTVAASTAAAEKKFDFTSDGHHTVFIGTSDAGHKDEFTTTPGSVTCKKVVYDGTTKATSTTTIALTPAYSECTAHTAAGTLPATIDVNSCAYTFHTETKDASGVYTGDMSIECFVLNDSIQITVSIFGTSKCTIHYFDQTIKGVTYKAANNKVEATISAGGLTYTETEGTGLGRCTGSEDATVNGTITGVVKIEGRNTDGQTTAIGLGDT
jgi:uncharacterized membrane protein